MNLPHLLDYSTPELISWLKAREIPQYRGNQVWRWLYQRRVVGFDEMTNLPLALRQSLNENFRLWSTEIVRHQTTPDGTEKLLLRLADGHQIECVLLRDGGRRTICISTQVGCAMGCVFCASGLDGVARNLSTGEIREQMLRLAHLLPEEERLSHVVVMGMGEPLANLDRLLPALETAHDPSGGLGISARRITISTVGLPPALERLAQHDLGYQLAVSLHAPDDALRNQLVPVNKNIGIAAVLKAADDFWRATGRRLTFEYVLLGAVNDEPAHAAKLAALLESRQAMVNLIPYNPVAGLPYATPSPEAVRRFREILEARGINVQVRERKGDLISAACGQLRRSAGAGAAVQ